MANQEQLKILKQGTTVWTKWRWNKLDIKIDLSGANLSRANLDEVDLRVANLNGTDLSGASLIEARLIEADLMDANLKAADLEEADLSGANLSGARLNEADLGGANLEEATLNGADLEIASLGDANLSYTDLRFTNFRGTLLGGADLSDASLAHTFFGYVDLSEVIGLESAIHSNVSTLGTDTLALSRGKIPEVFLRGCGLSDWEIESAKLYNPELDNEERNKILYKIYDLQSSQAVQISPLFISYSHADKDFVNRMEESLNRKGIRFWRDIHHSTAGRLEKQIDRAIRQNPTVLLVLSKNSIQSDWVEHEVNLARKLEKEIKRDVLCPVALDDSWKTNPWSEVLMEQVMKYNILDYSIWEDDAKFEKMFVRLIDGLNLFYKKEAE